MNDARDLIQDLDRITQVILEIGRRGDFDALPPVALEYEHAQQQLLAHPLPLSAEDRVLAEALLGRHEQIQNLLRPARDNLKRMLRLNSQEKVLSDTYRV